MRLGTLADWRGWFVTHSHWLELGRTVGELSLIDIPRYFLFNLSVETKRSARWAVRILDL